MANLKLFSIFSKNQPKNWRLFIGLNDRETLAQEIETSAARSDIVAIVGDCTLSEASGCYTMQSNGAQIQEKTIVCDVFGRTRSEVVALCQALKIKLNQESIAVMEVKNPTIFI